MKIIDDVMSENDSNTYSIGSTEKDLKLWMDEVEPS